MNHVPVVETSIEVPTKKVPFLNYYIQHKLKCKN